MNRYEGFYMKKNSLIILFILSLYNINCFIENSSQYKNTLLLFAAASKFKNADPASSFVLKAPNNLQAMALSSNRIDLTWSDISTDESGFRIERSAGGNFNEIITVSANQTSYSDTGLTPGITYYYRLRSYNSSGVSDYSPVASCTTTVSSSAMYHYVRSDAAGSNNGSDWNNAWVRLPDTLTRGHCYYIADGTYPGYTFDDAASGAVNIIIKKATVNDHGTSNGWQDSYGDGSAVFQPLNFTTSYYVIDGQVDKGFRIVGGFQGHVVSILSSGVTVRYCELDGNFAYDNANNIQTNGACTGVGIGDASPWNASYVTIENCVVHDIADDGFQIYNSDHVYIKNNTVHTLYNCGTDAALNGPCNNGHSDSMEIFNLKNSELSGNFIYDNRAINAALFFSNDADQYGGYAVYCKNITLINNIFYTPLAGFVVYFDEADGIKAYNNIFWGKQDGRYGGVSIWRVNNLDMYNNIILSIYYGHMGDVYNPAQHRGDYNLFGHILNTPGEYPKNTHDIVNANPGFVNNSITSGVNIAGPTSADFLLTIGSPCIDAGYIGDSAILIPVIDYSGITRPQGNGIDIGAHEYNP
jgi:hypothetical protein